MLKNPLLYLHGKSGPGATFGLASLLTAAVLVWSGHSLARLFWSIYPVSESSVVTSIRPVSVPAVTAQPLDLAAVRQAFELIPAGAGVWVDSVQQSGAADTRLDLVLRGAMVSTLPQRSRAIIASGDEQHVYQPGDTLRGTSANVELLAIHGDHVILRNAGREERLGMYETTDRVAIPAVVTENGMTVSAQPAAAPTSSPLSNIIRLQVYQEDGRPAGLRIRHGSRADLLDDAGLQVGDLITAIDGEPVTQLTQLPGLMQRLEQSPSVELQVQRDGTRFELSLARSALGL